MNNIKLVLFLWSCMCMNGCFFAQRATSNETELTTYENLSSDVVVTTLNTEDVLITGEIAKIQAVIYMGCTYITNNTSANDHELTSNLLKRQERREEVFMDLITLKHAPLPKKIAGDEIKPYDELIEKWTVNSDHAEIILKFHQDVHRKLHDILEVSKSKVSDPELNKVMVEFLAESKLILNNLDAGTTLE